MMDIEKYLLDLKLTLLKEDNWKEIVLTRQWTSSIPSKAGVYALKEENELVYIGETGNLRGRMTDLLDSRHHTVRRSIGKKFFALHEGFVPATTKNKFPDHIEILVNGHICNNLRIAFLPVSLGRKELEEFIEKDIKEGNKLNKRGKSKER